MVSNKFICNPKTIFYFPPHVAIYKSTDYLSNSDNHLERNQNRNTEAF